MDANAVSQLAANGEWIALAAVVVGFLTRLVKSDTKLPIDIPARYLPVVSIVLGLASGVLDRVVSGTAWKPAIVGGLVSGVIPMLGHDLVIGTLRNGNEVRVPGLMKGDPPPAPPPGGAGRAAGVAGFALGLFQVSAFAIVVPCFACTPQQGAKVLPAFDLAASVARQAANVVGFISPFFPEGDAKVAALKAAQAAHDFDRVFTEARPILERIAQAGEDVPQEVADDLVTGAAAASSIQNGMRAVSGRNVEDGSPKAP